MLIGRVAPTVKFQGYGSEELGESLLVSHAWKSSAAPANMMGWETVEGILAREQALSRKTDCERLLK